MLCRQRPTIGERPATQRHIARLLTLTFVLLGLALALPAGAFAAAGWSPQSSGTTANLYGVAFTNASAGWAVGENPGTGASVILATTNGGITWKAQSSGTTQTLYSVCFANVLDGWTVGARWHNPRYHQRRRHVERAELRHYRGSLRRRLRERQCRLGCGLRWHDPGHYQRWRDLEPAELGHHRGALWRRLRERLCRLGCGLRWHNPGHH